MTDAFFGIRLLYSGHQTDFPKYGTNAVVSSLEHPSAFDAVEYYCKKTGKELRVIPANPITGGIDTEDTIRISPLHCHSVDDID